MRRIGVDIRTIAFQNSAVRGIGNYALNHIGAVLKSDRDFDVVLYCEPGSEESVQKSLGGDSLDIRGTNRYRKSDVDLVHICDPMNLYEFSEHPLESFRHDLQSVTFYDIIPYRYYFATLSEELKKAYLLRLKGYLDSNCPFLAISSFTAKDLVDTFQVAPDRVITIMAGLNTSSLPKSARMQQDLARRLGITSRYFMHIGACDPHKNFDAVLDCFLARRKLDPDIQLVVVGDHTGFLARYAKLCLEQQVKGVIFTGFLQRHEVETLLQHAVALLFLSRYEGFGFPVLEAMANGCPVISTAVTSIPEVAGDAALLFDPEDLQGIDGAMRQLLSSPDSRESLRAKGLRQAASFSWEKTAQMTIAAWEGQLARAGAHRTPTLSAPAAPLRVLFDISVLGLSLLNETSRTGVFRVVEQLALGLASRREIELFFCSIHGTTHDAPQVAEACRHYLADSPTLRQIPFFEGNLPQTDVYHSPYHMLSPRVTDRVRFLMIHDLIALRHPEFFMPQQVDEARALLRSIRPDDFLLANSQATKNDFCQFTDFPPERVFLTPLAPSRKLFSPCSDRHRLQAVREKYGIGSRPYLLSLCTLEPRKNLEHIIRSFARLVHDTTVCPDLLLVLVGTQGWAYEPILEAAGGDPQVAGRIVLTGYAPDEELAPLYSGARAFVYMSHYEGFGLPPLEAMECGTPVITSNTSSLPEVVGDAGLLLDPRDQEGLCQAMREVATNDELHREMSRRSPLQAARFSWERFLTQTIDAYRSASPALPREAGRTDIPGDAIDRAGFRTPKRAQSSRPARRLPVTVIDGVFFQLNNTGIARVWLAILSQWAGTEFGDSVVVLDRIKTAPRIPGIRYRIVPAYDIARQEWDRAMLQQVCDDEGADLFVSTYYTTPLTTPSVFLAHDMIPEFTNYFDLAEPQWQEKHHAISRASAFIAVSRSTAVDLGRLYPELAERVVVAHNGIDREFFSPAPAGEVQRFRERHGLTKPYFVFVGRLNGYKNGRLLLDAVTRLPDPENYTLLFIGGQPELQASLQALAGDADVRVTRLSDQELRLAYCGAAALVYPSKYEGFGLPILEAMGCNCPVITCQNSSLQEVAGAAALYVSPDDPGELASALQQIQMPEVRNQLIKMGARQAGKFSWEKMAGIIQEVICDHPNATERLRAPRESRHV